MVLLICGFQLVYFLICANRLYLSANRKFSFDIIILLAESVKLQLFLINQFLFLHQSMLVLVEYVYSVIQFFIAWGFVNKVLTIANQTALARIMSVLMLGLFLIMFFISAA